jgi:hypothetical protein
MGRQRRLKEEFTKITKRKILMNRIVKKSKPRGLGDTVENFTQKTGIKKVVEKVAGEECGCGARRDALNRMFPYDKK